METAGSKMQSHSNRNCYFILVCSTPYLYARAHRTLSNNKCGKNGEGEKGGKGVRQSGGEIEKGGVRREKGGGEEARNRREV